MLNEASRSGDAPSPWGERPSVLLVDDDPDGANTVSNILRQEQYDVAIAISAPDALRALTEQPFDVVLIELALAETDGLALLNTSARTFDERRVLSFQILTFLESHPDDLTGEYGEVIYGRASIGLNMATLGAEKEPQRRILTNYEKLLTSGKHLPPGILRGVIFTLDRRSRPEDGRRLMDALDGYERTIWGTADKRDLAAIQQARDLISRNLPDLNATSPEVALKVTRLWSAR